MKVGIACNIDTLAECIIINWKFLQFELFHPKNTKKNTKSVAWKNFRLPDWPLKNNVFCGFPEIHCNELKSATLFHYLTSILTIAYFSLEWQLNGGVSLDQTNTIFILNCRITIHILQAMLGTEKNIHVVINDEYMSRVLDASMHW